MVDVSESPSCVVTFKFSFLAAATAAKVLRLRKEPGGEIFGGGISVFSELVLTAVYWSNLKLILTVQIFFTLASKLLIQSCERRKSMT